MDYLPYASRHVRQIENEKTMIVGLFAHNPHAIAPGASGHVVAINADMDLVVRADKTSVLGCSLVHVVDIAMSRVSCLKE